MAASVAETLPTRAGNGRLETGTLTATSTEETTMTLTRLALAIMALVCFSAALADGPAVVRLSEPVASDAGSETFGAPLAAEPAAVPLAEVIADADRFVDRPIVVTARIDRVCQKKGCFFIARDGDALVRVSFKDYSFFIPTDTSGRQATFAGELRRETVSEESANHYANDLGDAKPDLLETGPAYTIVASAIRISR
jgi:hypothetical protein